MNCQNKKLKAIVVILYSIIAYGHTHIDHYYGLRYIYIYKLLRMHIVHTLLLLA